LSLERTFLHLAVLSKNAFCIELLRKSEIDVFAVDTAGRTALHYIALNLDKGNSNGAHMLLYKALTKDLTDADLERLVNYQDAQQRTALHYAIIRRNNEVARCLLARGDEKPPHPSRKTGAKLLPDNRGYNAFHLALSAKDGDACRLLIDRMDPVELVKPDAHKRSILHWLVAHGDHHTNGIWEIEYFWKLAPVEAIVANNDALFDDTHISPIHIAAEKGNVDAVTNLIKLRPDLAKLCDNKNRTPLHIASQFGQIEVVNELYSAEIDVDARDNRGRTPLMYAAASPNFDMVWNLLQHNAKGKDIVDNKGWSAAEHAAAMNSRQALAIFVAKEIISLSECEQLLSKHNQVRFSFFVCLSIQLT